MKSTFNICFYAKKDKQKANGAYPLFARITVDGVASRFNTKLDVLPSIWDGKMGKATGRTSEASRINRMLDDINASLNRRVKYWKKSKDLHVFVKECTRLPPPSDSVAMEYLQQDYQFIYKFEEKAQRISKSTWFDLKSYDEDTDFYEYCIPTKTHQTVLSIIWED